MSNKLFGKMPITVSNATLQVHYLFKLTISLTLFLKGIGYQLLFIIILIGFLQTTKNYLQSNF